ncbi:hypothetical protein HID58_025809 [Brassica napus]|uniref:Pectinesterase inhibitor domain-containing protein n=1 Tax=Brassica napus TaxID=3708 RepID=A0ABQ8CM67_BRANA|nr:hypothetical protein HID58_025809 [Brassica napus]
MKRTRHARDIAKKELQVLDGGVATCLSNFNSAFDNLDKALKNVKENDGFSLNINLSAALTDYDTCSEAMKGSKEINVVYKSAGVLYKMADNCLALSTLISVMEMDTDEALHHLCHRFSGAYEKRDSEKNRKGTPQGLTSSRLQFQWRVSWEREEEVGGEVGKTMSCGCGHCGHETWNQVRSGQIRGGPSSNVERTTTSSSRDADRGCVDVIGVDGSCMDVVIVDMRLEIKCEVREEEAGREVGTTMVSRSELWCGEDDATSSSRDVDKGCVGVIGVDDSCVDVVVVVMRFGVKCEMMENVWTSGPLRLGAGRVWAHVLISRNDAGLAGKGLCGMDFMRDGPIETATSRHRQKWSSGDGDKLRPAMVSSAMATACMSQVGEDVKWALCFDSLPVNKDDAGYDVVSDLSFGFDCFLCRPVGVLVNKEEAGPQVMDQPFIP